MANDFPPQTRPIPPTVGDATTRNGISASSQYGDGTRSGGGGSGGEGGGDRYSGYGSPFNTLSTLSMPTDLRTTFACCRELAESSVTHAAYVRLMSTLPVTDLVFKSTTPTSDPLRQPGVSGVGGSTASDSAAVAKLSDLAQNHWKLRKVAQELARAFFTYSNAVVVLSYPFTKMLSCVFCAHREDASRCHWHLRPMGRFHWVCPKCNRAGDAHVVDHFLQVPEEVRFLVLDMEQMDAVVNDFRGTVDLYYEIPQASVDRLRANPLDKDFICSTPQAYLEAAMGRTRYPLFTDLRPRVKLRQDLCFFLRAASLTRSNEGFAYPELAATFRAYWLRAVLEKSQEAIHAETALLKRFIFPENYGQTDSLMNLVNLSRVQEKLRDEYDKMRRDPGYVGVAPFKVGQALLGGEAKSISLAQDIKICLEMESAGMQVPIEALFGGLQYSGASVSLKQVESRFEDFRSGVMDMLRWGVGHVCKTMRLPSAVVELKPFRLGDDIPFLQLLSGLNGQNLLSMRHVHTALNVDTETEKRQLNDDAKFRADLAQIQGKADAATQEEAILRGAAATAQGEVAGMEAQLDARAELKKKVMHDPELYALVSSDPQLAAQILGAASPEAAALGAGAGMGQPVEGAQVPPDQLTQYIDQYAGTPDAGQDAQATAVENSEPAYGPPGA